MRKSSYGYLREAAQRYQRHFLTFLTLGFLMGTLAYFVQHSLAQWLPQSSGPGILPLLLNSPLEFLQQMISTTLLFLIAHKVLMPEVATFKGVWAAIRQPGNLIRVALVRAVITTIVAIPFEISLRSTPLLAPFDGVSLAFIAALFLWLLAGAYMLLPLSLAIPVIASETTTGWEFLRKVYRLAKGHWGALVRVKVAELLALSLPAAGIAASKSSYWLVSHGWGWPLFMGCNWVYFALLPLSGILGATLYRHCAEQAGTEITDTLEDAA